MSAPDNVGHLGLVIARRFVQPRGRWKRSPVGSHGLAQRRFLEPRLAGAPEYARQPTQHLEKPDRAQAGHARRVGRVTAAELLQWAAHLLPELFTRSVRVALETLAMGCCSRSRRKLAARISSRTTWPLPRWWCGLRRGEAFGLKLRDVDRESGVKRIRQILDEDGLAGPVKADSEPDVPVPGGCSRS
jgi:integrase